MSRIRVQSVLAVLLCLLAAGCAARFSSEIVREEIVRQRGVEPLGVFEVNLGRFSTLMLKSLVIDPERRSPFAGLTGLQVAVYEAPSESGPAIDVTRFDVRGWEPVLRMHDSTRSALLLVRGRGERRAQIVLEDLVVVGAGGRNVIYARLEGSLPADLPSMLGDVLREGGPEALRKTLADVAEGGATEKYP